jgi:ATP-binding cassette subfamily C protein
MIHLYLEKHSTLYTKLKDLSYKNIFNTATITYIFVDITHIASTIIILAYSLQLYCNNNFTLGKTIAILEYFRYIVDPIDLFNSIYNQYLRSSRYIERLYTIIQHKAIDTIEYKPSVDLSVNHCTNRVLSFQNVTCIDNNSILLDTISFDINKNEKVAIIGRSGEGKSIIIDILLKNIPISRGCVEFMGMNIEALDRAAILSTIGYYSQDIYILNDTIENNIGNKRINHTNIDIWIRDYGLEHLKGRLLGENGINISKGEKSRIELLRLLLNNRDFILLDEPFDGLDSITKQEMIEKIRSYLEDKTSIIISHDFHILNKLATKYILIDNNKKLLIGTHDTLYTTNMLYKELYNKSMHTE